MSVLALAVRVATEWPKRLGFLMQKLYINRWLIWQLAIHELRARYAATVVGSVWAIINPVIMILVFWFVSTYGLRITFETGPPYFLVLFCGLMPWMMFNDAVTGGAASVISHQYLVKKIAFPLEVLPIVNVVSATVVHCFLVVLLLVILLVSGVRLTLHAFQALYFLVGMIVLATGLAWGVAALNVFNRDVGQALASIMTVWFWATPIVWPGRNLSSTALGIIQLNPVYYVVEGYRNAFLYARPLAALWPLDLYFWGVTATLFLAGGVLFRRLKPHFADVL